MRRIGIAASKIARGNVAVYHVCVVCIALLCALLLLCVCGFAIISVLFVLSLILRPFVPAFHNAWFDIVKVSVLALSGVVGVLTIIAILKNIKWHTKYDS